jgi:hypothetical protein
MENLNKSNKKLKFLEQVDQTEDRILGLEVKVGKLEHSDSNKEKNKHNILGFWNTIKN